MKNTWIRASRWLASDLTSQNSQLQKIHKITVEIDSYKINKDAGNCTDNIQTFQCQFYVLKHLTDIPDIP